MGRIIEVINGTVQALGADDGQLDSEGTEGICAASLDKTASYRLDDHHALGRRLERWWTGPSQKRTSDLQIILVRSRGVLPASPRWKKNHPSQEGLYK